MVISQEISTSISKEKYNQILKDGCGKLSLTIKNFRTDKLPCILKGDTLSLYCPFKKKIYAEVLSSTCIDETFTLEIKVIDKVFVS